VRFPTADGEPAFTRGEGTPQVQRLEGPRDGTATAAAGQ